MITRNFLTIDIIIQTILISINTWLIIFLIFSLGSFFTHEEYFFSLLITQFFIGTYQLLISSNVNLAIPSHNSKMKDYRRFHRASSWIYISILFLGMVILIGSVLAILFYILIPQLIAYTYFILSIADWQNRGQLIQKRSITP